MDIYSVFHSVSKPTQKEENIRSSPKKASTQYEL